MEKVYRTSKYTQTVLDVIVTLGHCTNADILAKLKNHYPDLSATTIHRITARMLEQGLIMEAPKNNNGAIRYETTDKPHDHFMCNNCDGIKNVNVIDLISPILCSQIEGCEISGRLVIYGNCNQCKRRQS